MNRSLPESLCTGSSRLHQAAARVASSSPSRRRSRHSALQIAILILQYYSHDIILRWDFMEASQAVICCESSELTLEDFQNETPNPPLWTLHAIEDFTILANSAAKISVAISNGYQNVEVTMEENKMLLFEKERMILAAIITQANSGFQMDKPQLKLFP
ncbi:hypothetical protein TNCT_599811 [Trichonephila clavata]|uniref:Uncharacterized protein n=1 Tax=Trichonephila clavata TaxID=2740835 RepID=A0A8X6HIH2_TRICU|nr:hypothetical protein TNCT_599811 [Trichonephila clavata]